MIILNQTNSVGNHYLAELRSVAVQTDRLRFRSNLKRLGCLMAYEISKSFKYTPSQIQTPLAIATESLSLDQVVLVSVLRASIPFTDGFLEVFDKAEVGFIGAWRKEGETVEVELNYASGPDLNGKVLILADPMLATGQSLVMALDEILKKGDPSHIHLASVIAAPEGVEYVKNHTPPHCRLWTWALDEKLNNKAYIVPGLGDAGDLSFGSKI